MVDKVLKSTCNAVETLSVDRLRAADVCKRLATRCLYTLAALCVGSAFFQPSFVSAQTAAAPSREQIARMAIPKGALFKATKDGKTVHLFGTMHVGSQTTLPLGRQVIDSLAESQALLLELDFSDPKLAAEFDKYSAAKKPINLTAPQREAALNAAKVMNIPAEKMLNLRPMMLAAMVTLAQGHAIGLKADYGSDLFLFGVALGARISVVGMETIEDQLKMEDELNESELEQMVQEAFNDVETKRAIKMLNEMSAAWIKGDLNELARVSEITKNSVSRKILIASNKRNYVMVEKIVAVSNSAKKPVFAAAGALHFWGDESIQSLLQKRGYQIERIH
jgi:uncharacterized protein